MKHAKENMQKKRAELCCTGVSKTVERCSTAVSAAAGRVQGAGMPAQASHVSATVLAGSVALSYHRSVAAGDKLSPAEPPNGTGCSCVRKEVQGGGLTSLASGEAVVMWTDARAR